jgi:hypothetical protein
VREPHSASDALQRLLERLGLDRQLRTYRALMHWDEIVGAQLAQVARPLRIDAHTLWVAVKSHAWMQELTFHKRTILQRLNAQIGEERFREVRFTVRAELPTAFQTAGDEAAPDAPRRTAALERSGACRSRGEPAGHWRPCPARRAATGATGDPALPEATGAARLA